MEPEEEGMTAEREAGSEKGIGTETETGVGRGIVIEAVEIETEIGTVGGETETGTGIGDPLETTADLVTAIRPETGIGTGTEREVKTAETEPAAGGGAETAAIVGTSHSIRSFIVRCTDAIAF